MSTIEHVVKHNAEATLKNAQIYKDNRNRFYMHLEYEREKDDGLHKITIPKVNFPNCLYSDPTVVKYCDGNETIFLPKSFLDVEYGEVTTKDGTTHKKVFFVDEIVEPKIHEMTIEEIEKELGYPVKIVSEKESKDV